MLCRKSDRVSPEVDESGKSLGRVLGRCGGLPTKGCKQEQCAQASIARLENGICATESRPHPPAAEPTVGGRCTPRELQVICDLQKLEIGAMDSTQEDLAILIVHNSTIYKIDPRFRTTRPTLAAGSSISIERRTVVVGTVCGETQGTPSGTASTNPSCASQKEPLTPSEHVPNYPNRNRNRRRQRRSRDSDDQQPQRRSKPRSGPSDVRRWFACPFYRYNPDVHRNCLNYKLSRIVDVRLHICRFHTQPSYCPRCGTEFQDDPVYTQRDAHLDPEHCEVLGDVARPSGATSEQLESMASAAMHGRGCTEEGRWYAIWDIMFPGAPRPLSPFIDVDHEWSRIQVCAIIEQYRQNGGLQDFIRQLELNVDVLGVLSFFLDHIRDYTSARIERPPDLHDPRGDMSIPIPPLPPFGQPTASSRSDLPVLLPRPTHIDSTDTGQALPSHDPNLDAIDEELGYS
ncbi:hypothetical protein F4824DRAFT_463602 [Ustulina deusta]|nr:hypothetical protein F4824DRAFT_463602 [Ustulina deusta]